VRGRRTRGRDPARVALDREKLDAAILQFHDAGWPKAQPAVLRVAITFR
jgi:hypothetical protein